MYKILIFFGFWWLVNSATSNIVQTTLGKVQGRLDYYENFSYYSFLGIPYAEAPIGQLRFAPPVPKKPWLSTFNATTDGYVCPQKENPYTNSEMSEDCLTLNINVPNEGGPGKPVLVYIHGGEFNSLSGRSDFMYGPQLYLKNGVIVVKPNYRLGALGFLSVGTDTASGNAGLKDVLLALKWTKENIVFFGGDPDNITLGGNSAGAVVAHYMMLTEKTDGLFNRALLISGSALGFRFLAKYPLQNAFNLGRTLGYETNSTVELIQNLKEADAFDIVAAQASMGTNNTRNGLRPFAPFVPCVEHQSSHSIITREPVDIVRAGIPQNVPVVAGFNSDEGIKMVPTVQANPVYFELLQDNYELAIPSNILYPYGSPQSLQLAESIRQLYFKDKPVSFETINNYIELVGDTQFYYSIDSWIQKHKSRENSSDVFYYLFNFDGDLNWFKIRNSLDMPGTAHADEVGYSFVTNATKECIGDAEATSKQALENVLTMWTNFVKFGQPTPNGTWKKIKSADQRQQFIINNRLTMDDSNPFSERMEFWQEVYDQYYDYLISGGSIEPKIVP